MIYETHTLPLVAPMTDMVVRNRLLGSPLVVFDVGVQGGAATKWRFVGDQLCIYGFDPIKSVIDGLNAANRDRSRNHYLNIGLGNEDGERLFETKKNPMGSAFLNPHNDFERHKGPDGKLSDGWSTVTIAKLDTLIANGTVPVPDFIKMDCEGFEVEVLKGAAKLLANETLCGIESESALKLFTTDYSTCHFADLYREIGPHGFDVCDLHYYREMRADIPQMHPGMGTPDTFDFLFLRWMKNPTRDTVLKQLMIAELYVLPDVALRTLHRHRDMFEPSMVGQLEHFLRLGVRDDSAAPSLQAEAPTIVGPASHETSRSFLARAVRKILNSVS